MSSDCARPDSRQRDAASFFVLRNSAGAKRRGSITSSSAGVDVNLCADLPPRRILISWRNPDGTIYGVDKEDDSLDDGTPSDNKLIEHEANSNPPDKDWKSLATA